MNRLYERFCLSGDGWDFLARLLIADAWNLDVVSPGDVYLSHTGKKIKSTDPRLDSDQGWEILEELRDWLDCTDAASLFVTGFAFDEADEDDTKYRPQGLTGSADADASGKVDGEKFLLVAWYRRDKTVGGNKPRAIVSLVRVTDMDDVAYRHLLLVNPIEDEDGNLSFESVASHCGGLAWFGRWLYVASSDRLLVFDMEGIRDLKPQNADYRESDEVGYYAGKYHAAGYRYIVPLVAVYTLDTDTRGNFFDTLGLDRSTSPPRLVAAGYVSTSTKYDTDLDHAVVVFFDLDESSGLLATSGGLVESSDAAYHGEYYVQGVTAAGDRVWLCQGSQVNRLLSREIGWKGGTTHEWAWGGEGLTYSEHTDHLWNVTEFVGSRICFCVDRATVS